MKALAFRKALSERLLAGDIVVVDELKLAATKTKEFAGIVAKSRREGAPTLVVMDTGGQKFEIGVAECAERTG